MNKKNCSFGMLAMVLTFGILLVSLGGCGDNLPPPELDELLHTYVGPDPQEWDGEGEGYTFVYYLNPGAFEVFRRDLARIGKYAQDGEWEDTRDWDKGLYFAYWAERPNGSFNLELCKANNDTIGYEYTQKRGTPAEDMAAERALKSLLSKYMGPKLEVWEDEVIVSVYSLDYRNFTTFKTLLDKGDEYHQINKSDEGSRNWNTGLNFARWYVEPTGSRWLKQYNADNTATEYTYHQ
ncbi:MAG: hypothetical protein LBD22_04730 [Spirochaetaceae bacterium]|jgi:hypothetical protein|nr:hypothetical protein [Spirochaetaceae bacterium]